MDLNLKNKRVIVTGSSKGIGLEILTKFIDEEANVIMNSRNESAIDQIKNKKNCNFIQADVSKPEGAEFLINKSIELLGGIDILICNVGSGKSVKPGNENFSEWQEVFSKNFFSATNCIESAKSHLSKSNGCIVCISSICGSEFIEGAPVTYSVAKSSINSYVKLISRSLSDNNIRINAISPGNIIFDGSTWENKIKKNSDAVQTMLMENVPLKRFGDATEVANLALYLSSDLSSFITGAVWTIDGGQTRSI